MLSLRDAGQRLAAGAIAIAVGLGGGASAGCHELCQTSDPYPCQVLLVAPVPASEPGTLIKWNGGALVLVDSDPEDPLAEGACIGFLHSPRSEPWDQGYPPDPSLSAVARCVIAGATISLEAQLGDLRDLGPSTQSVDVAGSIGTADGKDSCDFNEGAWLTIDESAGGAAPFPAMVTADYRKVFHVEMHAGALEQACTGKISSFDATVKFTMIATDFHGIESMCVTVGC